MQFDYSRIRKDLFEDYYRDTSQISKENMMVSWIQIHPMSWKPDFRA